MKGLAGLEDALSTLGELLHERRQSCWLLIVGGGSLLLLGVIERPTADVDVVGAATADGYAKLDKLPAFLTAAVSEVGEALGLGEQWLNTGPAGLIDFGLPAGLAERVEVRRYGALEIHIPAVADLVCFKLYAAVDLGERSQHFQDLVAIGPSPADLLRAARWTRTHDPSPGFLHELRRILALLGMELDDADL